MIFGVDNTITDCLNNTSPNYQFVLELFEIFASSVKSQEHIIALSRDQLLYILKCKSDLSYNSRKIYDYLSRNFFTPPSFLKKKIIVTLSVNTITVENDFIKVPLNVALSNNFFKINFITEDINDKNFYLFIARAYCNAQTLKNIPLEHNFRNGGGNRCADIISDISNSSSIIIAALDSDKKFPTSPLGLTAQKVNNLKIKNPNCLFEKKILKVREAENLIPSIFLKKQKKLSINESISKLFISNSSHIFFFDLKNGLTKSKLNSDSQKKLFWNSVLNDYIIEPYSETIIPGLGNSILSIFNYYTIVENLNKEIKDKEKYKSTISQIKNDIDNLNEIKKFIYSPYDFIDDYLIEHWNEIGHFLTNWFIGYPRFIP